MNIQIIIITNYYYTNYYYYFLKFRHHIRILYISKMLKFLSWIATILVRIFLNLQKSDKKLFIVFSRKNLFFLVTLNIYYLNVKLKNVSRLSLFTRIWQMTFRKIFNRYRRNKSPAVMSKWLTITPVVPGQNCIPCCFYGQKYVFSFVTQSHFWKIYTSCLKSLLS